MLRKNLTNFTTILAIFILDRLSKIFIIKKTEILKNNEIYASKFINFDLVWNSGIGFGLFSFSTGFIYNLITSLIILVIAIIVYFLRNAEGFERFSFLFILGGALGNLFDRLFYNAVPDFIDLHINNFHWFIFNIADIFITIGVICLILVELFYKKKT